MFKYRGIWTHIFFAFLVVVFVLINNSGLNQNRIIQPSPIKSQASISREAGKVLRVVDGDTIKVLINNKEDTVRLIGIDSPEILNKRKPVQCFGKKASNKAKEILTGRTIVLESDPTQGNRDSYSRLLRYVFFDGLNFSKFMISEGYAYEYTFKNNVYKYQSEFENEEKKARLNKKGLWADGACD